MWKVKYKPSRDIPKACRELGTTSPTKICQWIQDHRTEQDARGKKKQVIRGISSITHWFERNPKVFKELEAQLKEEVFEQEALNESMFENGNFRELPSIKNWMRDLAGVTIEGAWLNRIKRVCMGNMKIKGGRLDIEGWGLKSPERLNLEDAKDFIAQLKRNKLPSREWRLALRSFLQSKGQVVRSSDISGELEQDAGQYAHLFVPKPKIYEIFAWLKGINKDAYLASKFSFTTGARLTATLEASTQYLNRTEGKILLFEKSKKRKKKRRVTKRIRQDLWEELDLDNRTGKLFNITETELNALLTQAYKEIIPELAHYCEEHGSIPPNVDRCPQCNKEAKSQIPMPFHFWRHMFAQHMLRKSGWNSPLVASLGGWTTGALEKYYGKADKQTIDKFAEELLPQI